MITFTGNNLNIVIYTTFRTCDKWKSFATWYSVIKTLPDAKINYFISDRNGLPAAYEWTTRAKIHRLHQLIKPALILSAGLIAVQDLPEEILHLLNSGESFGDETASFLTDKPFSKVKRKLWINADQETTASFVRFNKDDCPFYEASKIKPQTTNESKVIKMWAAMANLYDRLCRV